MCFWGFCLYWPLVPFSFFLLFPEQTMSLMDFDDAYLALLIFSCFVWYNIWIGSLLLLLLVFPFCYC